MSAWLGLDTATDFAGIALLGDDGLVAEHTWLARRRHTAELAPEVERVLHSAGLRPVDLGGGLYLGYGMNSLSV